MLALCVLLGAGCAHIEDRAAARRMSIKDDAVDHAPRMQSQTAAPVQRAATDRSAPVSTRAPVVRKISHVVAPEPTPRLPVVDTPTPAVKVVIDPPVTTKPAEPMKAAALEPQPAPMVPVAKPVEAAPKPVDVPKTASVIEPQQPVPPRVPVIIKPADVPAAVEARPTAEQRRKAIEQPKPQIAPAPASPLLKPAPAPAAAASATPAAKAAEPKVESIVVALTEEQRAAATLARADQYLKAGRYLDARTLLEDAAKGGNAQVLVALAETYDAMVLRERYPRLARVGEVEKAIAIYERARAAGARDLDARIAALKAAAGPKR